MILVNYIDKKLDYGKQKSLFTNFVFFSIPFGYLVSQIISIVTLSWEKYEFRVLPLIVHFLFFFILLTPLSVSYIRNKKKLKSIQNRILTQNEKVGVKFKYHYKTFNIGEVYDIQIDYFGQDLLYIYDKFNDIYTVHDFLGRVEINDIKLERKRKLKKMKKLF